MIKWMFYLKIFTSPAYYLWFTKKFNLSLYADIN